MNNAVYRRSESQWLTSHPSDKSLTYWRSQVRAIFGRLPQVDEIEIVKTGRKTDSALLGRGETLPAANQYVIIASTGGKWGKSRRDFAPRNLQT